MFSILLHKKNSMWVFDFAISGKTNKTELCYKTGQVKWINVIHHPTTLRATSG
jgi:hypothetical protein